MSDPNNIAEIAQLIRESGIQLLAGGPPCQPFSKAGRSKIRHRVQHALREPHDERRDLWRSFLEVVQLSTPAAVIMENVPDMALDREMFILRSIVEELEQLGYSVEERVVETRHYGVPQFRQRLILVALRNNLQFSWPVQQPDRVNVWNAIGDLPEVEGGWRPCGGAEGWAEYGEPVTTFQKDMRRDVPVDDVHKVFDHITRPVRDDDRKAFKYMTSSMRYSELETHHKRYREDIFEDKYKRLDENGLSRTITAHIAKDGYWYIHPRQDRTLTVREAARLQTFPDTYRFAGPPSTAFRQIGNAVPPRLGEALGRAVIQSLDAGQTAPLTSKETARILAEWFRSGRSTEAVPWLKAESRWHAVAAELILERASSVQIRTIWKHLQHTAVPARSPGRKEQPDLTKVLALVSGTNREARGAELMELATHLAKHPDALSGPTIDHRKLPGVTEATADLASLVISEEPGGVDEPVLVTRGVLRVARRFQGGQIDHQNRLTDGRMAVARMIGFDENSRDAHKARSSWPTDCAVRPRHPRAASARWRTIASGTGWTTRRRLWTSRVPLPSQYRGTPCAMRWLSAAVLRTRPSAGPRT